MWQGSGIGCERRELLPQHPHHAKGVYGNSWGWKSANGIHARRWVLESGWICKNHQNSFGRESARFGRDLARNGREMASHWFYISNSGFFDIIVTWHISKSTHVFHSNLWDLGMKFSTWSHLIIVVHYIHHGTFVFWISQKVWNPFGQEIQLRAEILAGQKFQPGLKKYASWIPRYDRNLITITITSIVKSLV